MVSHFGQASLAPHSNGASETAPPSVAAVLTPTRGCGRVGFSQDGTLARDAGRVTGLFLCAFARSGSELVVTEQESVVASTRGPPPLANSAVRLCDNLQLSAETYRGQARTSLCCTSLRTTATVTKSLSTWSTV